MIPKSEILDYSREFGLIPQVIEKDYVLGWILAGINHHNELRSWIFKGGTCLKKCYFETYRFSEDLDFTLPDSSHLSESFLKKSFSEVSEWVLEESGIIIPSNSFSFDIYPNKRSNLQCEGKIGYVGPLQFKPKNLPKIKLDLTNDELIAADPVLRPVYHPYSDQAGQSFQVLSYNFEEIFAEKTRALSERLRPRDLYDVVHLHRHTELKPNKDLLKKILGEKCKFKEIPLPTLNGLESHSERQLIFQGWTHALKHQLSHLPPFEQFWSELSGFFAWLYENVQEETLASIPSREATDSDWKMPLRPQLWRSKVPIEKIRFAAANRLCVELTYQGTKRLIEPYAIRRTLDDSFILRAIKYETQESRSYRLDRIEGVEISGEPFTPKYEIELTFYDVQSAPLIERS